MLLLMLQSLAVWGVAPGIYGATLVRAIYRRVFCGGHVLLLPFRLLGGTVQCLVCAQVLFLVGILAKMVWAIGCIGLCAVSAFVASYDGANSLTDFFNLYYWPP